jgi:hypothetical protein
MKLELVPHGALKPAYMQQLTCSLPGSIAKAPFSMQYPASFTTALTALLMILELLHIAAHVKVFFGLGQLYSRDEYRSKRIYFVVDAASVVVSYVCVQTQPQYWLKAMVIGHLLLHMYYISQWQKDTRLVNSIIDWSAEENHMTRAKQNGIGLYVYNTLGTAFDIAVHACLVACMANYLLS